MDSALKKVLFPTFALPTMPTNIGNKDYGGVYKSLCKGEKETKKKAAALQRNIPLS